MIRLICQFERANNRVTCARIVMLGMLAMMLCSCRGVIQEQAISESGTASLGQWAHTNPHANDYGLEDVVVRGNNGIDVTESKRPTGGGSSKTKSATKHVSSDKPLFGPRSRGPIVDPHPYAELPPGAVYHPGMHEDAAWRPPGIPGPWPRDEYIFDGGDQPVATMIGEDWSVRGLNMEDTIGHFDTIDGRRLVKPSNRVPIYAPRFAAVRRITGITAYKSRRATSHVHLNSHLANHQDLQAATTALHQVQPKGQIGSRSTTTFRERARSTGVDNREGLLGLENGFAPHENFQVIRHGQFDQSEKARLAEAIEAAVAWEGKQAVQVVVDGKLTAITQRSSRPQETRIYEQPKGKPRLRVVKVSSTGAVKPGETIDFTIRFDNVGDEVIGNVTIIDNLTPRLEYIDGSAQCDLKADFFTQENEGESLVLRWEITDPMEAETGGIIRFKCRVR